MVEVKSVSFNKFYITEFFEKVKELAQIQFSKENQVLIGELVNYLSTFDDFVNGLEEVAQEQSANELSIFLFDIIDRIGDYPPTLVYDSLPEIVEDFLNALSLMLEEDSFVQGIKKLNQQFSEQGIKEPELALPGEPSVSEAEIEEVKEEIEQEVEQPFEEVIEKPADIKEPIIEEETFSFEQFIEKEFAEELDKKLKEKFNAKKSNEIFGFVNLIIDNISIKNKKKIPNIIKDVASNLNIALPWKTNEAYKPSRLSNDFPGILDQIIENLALLNEEYPEIIKSSLKKKEIIIPEIKEEKKFVKEEVPEKPTTIDSLLSEYFQSEVNEYVQQLQKIIDDLKQSPDDSNLLNEIVNRFQSFKEVSMIHGYILIEDFCNGMIHLFTQEGKKKKYFKVDSFKYFDQLFKLLKSTENLKGGKKSTPDSIKLQGLLDDFSRSLFTKSSKPIEDLVEDQEIEEMVQPIEESAQEEIAEKKSEFSSEINIDFFNSEALFAVLLDLIQDVNPSIEKLFVNNNQIDQIVKILMRLESAASLVEQAPLSNLFLDFKDSLLKICEIEDEKQINALISLKELYGSFVSNLSEKIEFGEWQEELAKFNDSILKKDEEFGIDNTSQIFKVIVDIERNNLDSFPLSIEKIFKDKNTDEKEIQFKHFSRLKENLLLVGAENLLGFPEFFIKIFDPEVKIKIGKNVLDEIERSYKLLVESLESKKVGSEMEEIISLLKEMVFESDSEKELIEKETTVTQEADEDLEEIFKQEAENYLDKINEALSVLKKDISKKEQFNAIEKGVHSIKSSARLMGYHEIANVTAPLETICEQIQTKDATVDEETLSIIDEVIEGISKSIKGEQIDYDSLKKKLDGLLATESKAQKKVIKKYKEEETSREKPLFSASTDEDVELLEIFKEESDEFLKTIEKASKVLQTDLSNVEALSQLEYANHSLKTAAKMLGFREIGEIADRLELIAESIHKKELINNQSLNDLMSRSIKIIKNLTAGNKIELDQISGILTLLDIKKIKQGQDTESVKPGAEAVSALDPSTQLFLKEGWELIDNINRDLVKFEKSPGNREILNDLSRYVHTLKSSAQMLHFKKIGSIAHKTEDFFDYYKNSGKELSGENLDILFNGIDEIQNLMESIKSGKGENSEKYESTLNKIDKDLLQLRSEKGAVEQPKSESAPKLVNMEKYQTARHDEEQVIKITTDRLDNLVNMASELVVNKTQLDSYLEKLKKIGQSVEKDKKRFKTTNLTIEDFLEKQKVEKGRPKKGKSEIEDKMSGEVDELEKVSNDFKEILTTIDALSANFNSITVDFEQNFSRISSLTKLLYEDILQVRMVPTEHLFDRFPRAVRDLAKEQKKSINLAIEGEKTEMDRAMIESLYDPVMHLIRNAIDHGIELPKERTKKGKSEEGIILLKARQDKNQVIIEVQDDGQGIDLEQIKKTIIKKNLVGKEEIDKMSESEIFDFIFNPGFSTKKVVSDVSGRGVGLDVVSERLKRLKGDIRVNSTIDKGTTFSIRVPLTLTISQAMLVKVADEILAIPIMPVEETIHFEESVIIKKDEKEYLSVRGDTIPFFYLSNLLDYGEPTKSSEKKRRSAIIIREAEVKYGLVVDEVLHREEILIKSLGEKLSKVEYISGGTIFSDGSVALIVDTRSIARKVESDMKGIEQDFSSIEKAKQLSDLQEEIEQSKTGEPQKKEESITEKRKEEIVVPEKIESDQPTALIVDDSISIRKYVSSILEKDNFSTVLAKDGQEALEILEKSTFDIIITDLEMPKMQGFELIEAIRQQQKFKDTPIIILTGRASEKHKEKGMGLGASEYIVKPFKDSDLLNTVKKFIKVK